MAADPSTEHIRSLVLRHGWNATAYQLLNPGIRHWLCPDGDAVVGYATATTRPGGPVRMWIAAGGPVCAPERVGPVADDFEAAAARAGCRVCWFGADSRLRNVRAGDEGYSEMTLGAQPVWDPARWPAILAGKASLRAQRNRAKNKGAQVSLWASATATNHPALQRCLEEWLSDKGLPPLHFLVEPDTLGSLGDRRVFVAERAGAPVGFLILTPVPARRGWLVEQIIRGNDAPNGTATLLVDAAMRAAAETGSRYVTMGLSPLSTRGVRSSPNPVWLRLSLGWVRAHTRRFYNFRGLEAFKAKFVPDRWDPITAIANEPHPSPSTLYAIADAFSGPRSPVALVGRALAKAAGEEVRTFRRWVLG